MNTLPDPHRSAAVIAGVSRYKHKRMPDLPAVAGNRERLKEVLTDPGIWGLPQDRCHEVADPVRHEPLIDTVIEAAGQAQDTLIVYYAGHGFADSNGTLHLTHQESRNKRSYTAFPYEYVRQAILEHSRAQRRIVILDCCYSGLALDGMADPAAEFQAAAGINGTYVLTSAPEHVQALSPRGEECTAFTGELVRVLREGIPGDEEFLTLDAVYGEVLHTLRSKGRPEPQEQDRGQIGRLPFVRNRARGQASPPPQPRRGCALTVALGALLLAVAVPVTWRLATGEDRETGRCSARATLTGFDDRLDKARYDGHTVSGLSSLTMTGPSRLLSLADTPTPRVYELALEDSGKAETRLVGSTTLRREDGTPYKGEEFDGEAVVAEKGGRTALVASESGPTVGRFDLRTGRLLRDFTVPERFAVAPKGGGQRSESFEAMALSPDGRHLYVGLESPLSGDGSRQGRSPVRILRYKGTPGGDYVPDRQYAYETGSGLRLSELAATRDDGELLAVERGYAEDQGNAVKVHHIVLRGLPDVSGEASLADVPAEDFAAKSQLLDLAECPASGAESRQKQPNPLLDNVEGAALGPEMAQGPYAGRQMLYLVSDDNANSQQITRFYALAVAVP